MGNFLYTIIIYPLYELIEFSYMVILDIFKNPGISVIGVSLIISIFCLPLYIVAEHWQQVQRDTEKNLQPGIDRIKSSFKGDEQYMILSAYYKQHNYHPVMALRSSFGLLIQIPFFIAAYIFLSNLPALQGKSFLFIRNMGKPDGLFHIGSFPVNILPVAMTIINIIAGAIYTKGFKLKEKIQIDVMAVIFLILLYESPSGLVLYWTMNNIFSLIKNAFYKIKNPLRILYCLLCAAVIAIDCYLLFMHKGPAQKRFLAVCIFSLLFFIPLLIKIVQHFLNTTLLPLVENKKSRFSFFLFSALGLWLLSGWVIPSYIINSSVQEFSGIDGYGNPLYFLYLSLLQSFGLFVFWPLCIYFLFHNKIQTLISAGSVMLLFTGMVNAFLFSGHYGALTRLITFSNDLPATDSKTAKIINLLIVAVIIIAVLLLFRFHLQKITSAAVSIILIAECCICIVHAAKINKGYIDFTKNISAAIKEDSSITPSFHLSKTGRNVVIFMLDRAENAYVKPIFDSYPSLYDSFSGFTLYSNTLSYNGHTLLGAPPLFGGYDYTPSAMNKRSSEKRVDKHNEALLVLPRIFTEQGSGWSATLADASWANYSWIPDMHICNKYPAINGQNVERKYTALWMSQNPDKIKKNILSTSIKRNLLWFSIFKGSPLIIRDSIYNGGAWWSSSTDTDDIIEFLDSYAELAYLPELTDFKSVSENSFVFLVNETTHSNVKLQAPDFVPAIHVTNTGICPISHAEGFCGNAAAYKLLAVWLKYLKDNDVYDNTRIILVADHGIGTTTGRKLFFNDPYSLPFNPDHYHPLLMVKDFNASGKLTSNTQLMTNADVSYLATAEIIENPVNPFTHNSIAKNEKHSGVVLSTNDLWAPGMHTDPNVFSINNNEWYTVHNDMSKIENWHKGINK
jgi:YidC/Oxa1 family membrane protein insertase